MEDINEDYLTHLLRDAGYSQANVISFTREPVVGKSHGGGELHRFRLVLQDDAQQNVPTSLVLKTSQRPTSQSLDPGYELSFCLRPAHALGGPILSSILSGRPTMVGSTDLDARLTNADATFQRIERGVRRL